MSGFNDIKVGDKVLKAVCVKYSYYDLGEWFWKIKKVARVTKTQFVLENGDRYGKSMGYMIGGGYNKVIPYEESKVDPEGYMRAKNAVRLLRNIEDMTKAISEQSIALWKKKRGESEEDLKGICDFLEKAKALLEKGLEDKEEENQPYQVSTEIYDEEIPF